MDTNDFFGEGGMSNDRLYMTVEEQREALREREVLLKTAPHIIWPLHFILPWVPGLRPLRI